MTIRLTQSELSMTRVALREWLKKYPDDETAASAIAKLEEVDVVEGRPATAFEDE